MTGPTQCAHTLLATLDEEGRRTFPSLPLDAVVRCIRAEGHVGEHVSNLSWGTVTRAPGSVTLSWSAP